MNKTISNILAILIILLFAILFQWKYINEFPSYIHAWSQSDRYALALGFVNNNLNFFHPESFIMNPQFPDNWDTAYKTSITAVDFPINEYIVAIIMKFTGCTSPWIFRLFTLLYSLTGLFFLFKIALLLTKQLLKSFLVLIFAATSPVFIYYQSGFIPGISSLSNILIGLWFYLKYIQNNNNKHFWWSTFFLTLATLVRTSFIIPHIAVFCFELFRILKKESNFKPKILPVFLSFAFIASYFIWNLHLRKLYGSMFLNKLAYPENLTQAKELLLDSINRWGFHYFSWAHYALLVLALIVSFVNTTFIFSQLKNKSEKHSSLPLWILNLIWMFGCILFLGAMLKQYSYHDYYFLDTFYLPIIFWFILILKTIPNPEKRPLSLITGCLVLLLFISYTKNGLKMQRERRTYEDGTNQTISDFENSAEFLNSLGIDRKAKILVINASPQNIAFILMKRKGFIISWPNRERLLKVLKWKWDYLIFQNSYYFHEYMYNPDILSRFHKVADNGKITVCTLSDTIKNQDPVLFYAFNSKKPRFLKTINFDSSATEGWFNIDSTADFTNSGNTSSLLGIEKEWGTGYKSIDLHYFRKSITQVLFSGKMFSEKKPDCCFIVFTVEKDGIRYYHQTFNINYLLNPNQWNQVNALFSIPQIEIENGFYRLDIYIPCKHSNIYLDDLKIAFY
jgi:hypothetical protein